jgi:uncharacterized protein involved in exopolysaccharide biosynthesis
MNQTEPVARTSDEITLRDFVGMIKRSRIILLVIVGVFSVLGISYGFIAKRKYEATTVLQPVAQSGTGSHLGSLAAQYGGLASLVGISMPESGMKAEAVAVLQSELLTQRYIAANNLLPILFANKWNSARHQWNSQDPKNIPTLWLGNKYFKNSIRTVVTDKKTGMVDLTIKWINADEAARWANGLVSMTNEYLRQKAISEAKRNIRYLQTLASKTTVVAERRVVYALMEQQIDKEMVARDRKQYALKIVDPAFAPGEPTIGGPILWGLLGFIFGMFVSVILIFVRMIWAVV